VAFAVSEATGGQVNDARAASAIRALAHRLAGFAALGLESAGMLAGGVENAPA